MKTLIATMILAASAAHAEGLHTDLQVGAGLEVGRLAFNGPASDGSGDLHFDNALVAPAINAGLFVGPKLSPTVAIGVALDASLLLNRATSLGEFVTFDYGYQVAATVRAVVAPTGRMRWYAGGGLGMSGFAGGGVDVGSPMNVVRLETLVGPVVRGGVSWNVSPNVVAGLDAHGAALFGGNLNYLGLELLAGLHMAGW